MTRPPCRRASASQLAGALMSRSVQIQVPAPQRYTWRLCSLAQRCMAWAPARHLPRCKHTVKPRSSLVYCRQCCAGC